MVNRQTKRSVTRSSLPICEGFGIFFLWSLVCSAGLGEKLFINKSYKLMKKVRVESVLLPW